MLIKSIIGLSILLGLSGCSSGLKSTRTDLSFSNIEKLQLEKTTKSAVLDQLGSPSNKRDFKGNEIWDFEDSKNGAQRLSLEFNNANYLISMLWIPRVEDPERQLQNVFSRYPKVSFKPIESREEHHSTDSQTTYSDRQSMSILFDDRKQNVEAMSWFLPHEKRTPSQSEKN